MKPTPSGAPCLGGTPGSGRFQQPAPAGDRLDGRDRAVAEPLVRETVDAVTDPIVSSGDRRLLIAAMPVADESLWDDA